MEWVMCHHFVGEKKIQVNNFFNVGTFISLSPLELYIYM